MFVASCKQWRETWLVQTQVRQDFHLFPSQLTVRIRAWELMHGKEKDDTSLLGYKLTLSWLWLDTKGDCKALCRRPAGGGCWHWHWDTLYNCYDCQRQLHILCSKNTTASAVRRRQALQVMGSWTRSKMTYSLNLNSAEDLYYHPWHHSTGLYIV